MSNTPHRLETAPPQCASVLIRALFCFLIFALCFCGSAVASNSWDGTIGTGFAGGDGSETTPYLIANASQLAYLANETNYNESFETGGKYFKLTADIDLGDKEWTPIGEFLGNFDGDGKNITGLNVTGEYEYAGLFVYVHDSGNITNLTVEGNITVSPAESFIYVGGIVGISNGTISHSTFNGNITVSSANSDVYAGGIVGKQTSLISYCNSYGSIDVHSTNETCIGGIVGWSWSAGDVVESCTSAMDLFAEGKIVCAGGIIGWNYEHSSITRSEASCSVLVYGDTVYAGGIVGYNCGSISSCSVTKEVFVIGSEHSSTNVYAGGVAGRNDGSISECTLTNLDIQMVGSDNSRDISAGGIAGLNYETIYDCTFNGNVSASVSDVNSEQKARAGGIAGENEGEISGCQSSGTIKAESSANSGAARAGGIVGTNRNGGEITACTSSCTVTSVVKGTGNSESHAGGIAGYNYGNESIISDCKSSGTTKSETSAENNDAYRSYAGGVVGFNNHGTISNSESSGATVITGYREGVAGGIAGYNFMGEISSSKASGAVTAKSRSLVYVGGIMGKNTYGIIDKCSSSGNVVGETTNDGSQSYVGGVAGWNSASSEYESKDISSIKNSFSTGNVSGKGNIVYVGGVTGCNSAERTSADALIENCYAVGTVTKETTGAGYAGGIVGFNNADAGSVSIKNSYSAVDITSDGVTSYVGGIVGQNCAVNGSTVSVDTCYATGSLTSRDTNFANVGGIAGTNFAMSGEQKSAVKISNSYALNEEISVPSDKQSYYVAKVVVDANVQLDSFDISLTNNYAWSGMKVTGISSSGHDGTSISSAEVWGKLFGQFTDANGWKIGTSANFKLPVLKSIAEPDGADAKHLYYEAPSSPSGGSSSKPSKPVDPVTPEEPSEPGIILPSETVIEDTKEIIVSEETTEVLETGETVTVVELENTEVVQSVAVPEEVTTENPEASIQITEGNKETVHLPVEITTEEVHVIIDLSVVDKQGNPIKIKSSGYFILDADVPDGKKLAVGHYKNGVWEDCKVEDIGNEQYKVHYNGLSPFAAVFIEKHEETPFVVAENPIEEPETPDTPESPMPILAVLAGLGAAVVLRRK